MKLGNFNYSSIGRIPARVFYRRLYIASALVFVSLGSGILGFILIEGYTLLNAIYMTVITLSTVGFKEVHPLTQSGKIFTTIWILFNIGIFAYSLSIISAFVLEGEFKRLLRKRRIERKISKMKNHVIVCGYGRYGHEIIGHLKKHKLSYVVIDQDDDKILAAERDGIEHLLQEDAVKDETLLEANIKHANCLITTLPEDADNLYVLLTAKHLNPDITVISRANKQGSVLKLKRAGADHVVLPDQIGGFFMATLVSKPDAVEFFTILTEQRDVGISFEEIRFDKVPDKFKGKTIAELNIRQKTGANIIAIKTPDDSYRVNPPANTVLEEHMGLIVLGDQDQVQRFKEMMTEVLK